MTTRREFLAAAAIAAGAAALPARAGVKRGRSLRKAVMLGMASEGATLREKFEIIRDAGFEGVEVDGPTTLDADELLAAQSATGVTIHGVVNSVHWRLYLNSPDAKARDAARAGLEAALHDAAKYGSSSVLLVPAVVNERHPYDEAWRLSIEEIRRTLPLARELGVVIAVENVWNNFLLSPLEAARYVDEFNDPLVRFHFDIGNVVNFGYPAQWVRILGSRIAKLHIKDFSRRKRDDQGLWKGFEVELGEGDAGWSAVMRALDETGYSTAEEGRWATAEVRGGDRKRLAQISGQMDRLFAIEAQ